MPYSGKQGWNKWSGTMRTAVADIEEPTIDLETENRELVPLKEGGQGTIYSATFEDEDGSHRVIPTIVGGKQLNPEDAYKHSLKTGRHLGRFSSSEMANQAANERHLDEETRGKTLGKRRK